MIISDQTLKQLGRQVVLDENGNPEMLSNLWKDQKTVLVFIRHFG